MITECKCETSACFGPSMISSDVRESRQFGFWIPRGESRIRGIVFQYLSVELGVWNSIVSGIIIIIIITLFESQIILAEHECCTNWGDCKSNKSNQIKCWFLRRGENRSSRRKTSRSRVENQQTQPTYDAGSGNRTRDTLVEGERSHHYTNPAPFSCIPHSKAQDSGFHKQIPLHGAND